MSSLTQKLDVAWDKIDWNPVFQKGAESLASSLCSAVGSSVGGAIGKAIVDALLGNSSAEDAFKKEVIERLDLIEQKLDKLIYFVYTELPSVVYTEVTRVAAEQILNEIHAKSIGVTGWLSSINRRGSTGGLTNEDFLILSQAGAACFELGIRVIRMGQEWYLGGIHAYISGYAAFSRIIRDRPQYFEFLVEQTKEFNRIMLPWILEKSLRTESFADLAKRLPEELEWSLSVLESMKDRKVFYALGWEVVDRYETRSAGIGAHDPFPVQVKVGRDFVVTGGWWQVITSRWALDGDDVFVRLPLSDGDDPASDSVAWMKKAGFEISPAWSPINGFTNMSHYNQMVARLELAISKTQRHKERIRIVNGACDAISHFCRACSDLDVKIS